MKKRTFVCIESSRTSLDIPETQKKQAPPVPKVFDSNIHSSSQTHIPKKLKPHTKNNNFAGIFPSNVLPQIRNKSDVEKIKHFQILPVSQFIWVLLGSFSSSWLSHIWYSTFCLPSSSKAQYWRRSSNPLASSSREDHSWDHSIHHTGLPLSQGQAMGKGSNHGKTSAFW